MMKKIIKKYIQEESFRIKQLKQRPKSSREEQSQIDSTISALTHNLNKAHKFLTKQTPCTLYYQENFYILTKDMKIKQLHCPYFNDKSIDGILYKNIVDYGTKEEMTALRNQIKSSGELYELDIKKETLKEYKLLLKKAEEDMWKEFKEKNVELFSKIEQLEKEITNHFN